MTATDIKSSFRELDLDERIKLLGELWDEVSTEPTLFDLSEDERKELSTVVRKRASSVKNAPHHQLSSPLGDRRFSGRRPPREQSGGGKGEGPVIVLNGSSSGPRPA